MNTNWGLDVTVGAVPFVGDLFDLAFKSNTKNVRLLIDEIEKRMGKGHGKAGAAFDGDIIEHAPLETRVPRPPDKTPISPNR